MGVSGAYITAKSLASEGHLTSVKAIVDDIQSPVAPCCSALYNKTYLSFFSISRRRSIIMFSLASRPAFIGATPGGI